MAHSTTPAPDRAVREATTERIFAHARRGWPSLPVLVALERLQLIVVTQVTWMG